MSGFVIIFVVTGLAVAAVGFVIYFLNKPPGPAGSAVGMTRVLAFAALILLGITNIWIVAATLNGDNVEVTVPVRPYWPENPNLTIMDPIRGDSVSSVMTEVHVTSSELSLTTRILLASGSLLQGVAVLAVLVAVIALCNRLRAAQPFTQSLPRIGRITAVVIILGSLIGQILEGIAASRAGEESLRVTAWASEGGTESITEPWPLPTWLVNVEFGTFFVALGILVVAELISQGIRIDAERRRLQTDTDGLI